MGAGLGEARVIGEVGRSEMDMGMIIEARVPVRVRVLVLAVDMAVRAVATPM